MSALNNLRKKETSLTLGDDLLLAERVGSYNKTFKERKEKDAVEDTSKKLLKNYVLQTMLSIQRFFVFSIAFSFLNRYIF